MSTNDDRDAAATQAGRSRFTRGRSRRELGPADAGRFEAGVACGFAVLLAVAFVVLVHFVVAHHEPWRDEADPWLYVRDAEPGHDPGEDALRGAARRSGSSASRRWPSSVSRTLPRKSSTSASPRPPSALMAWRAPFSRLTKVLIAFSYYFAYEYAVIVRSYAVTTLLTFAAAALYPRSRERPIAFALVLLLLFNCNAQGFFIAGTFAALFVLEGRFDRSRIAAIAIMTAAAVVAYLQVRTPPDPARQAVMRVFNRDAFAWCVSNAFLPTLPAAIGFVVGMALLLARHAGLRRSREARALSLDAAGGLSIIYSYVWLGGLRHAGFFLLLTLVAIWIGARTDRHPLGEAGGADAQPGSARIGDRRRPLLDPRHRAAVLRRGGHGAIHPRAASRR